MKIRAAGIHAAQSRAVTKNDYEEPADRNYWLGQKRIAPLTNVKKKGS